MQHNELCDIQFFALNWLLSKQNWCAKNSYLILEKHKRKKKQKNYLLHIHFFHVENLLTLNTRFKNPYKLQWPFLYWHLCVFCFFLVKYLNAHTGIVFLRFPKQCYKLLWSALPFVTSIESRGQKIHCFLNCLHVGGIKASTHIS